jgi:hypothetical protein
LGGRLQFQHLEGGDPYALVISLNVLRRHLTAEKRIELAEELAKADPTMSARRIAKLADISPTTAVKAKTKVQETGDVSTVDTSISVDTKGRKQPAKKRKPKLPSYIPTQEAAPKPIAPSPASTPKGASGVVELAHKHIAEIVGLMRLMTQPERLRFRQEMLRAVADEMVTPPGDAA